MQRIEGEQGQLIGVRLHHKELKEDPDLFYRVLDDCRKIWYKTRINEKLPGDRVRLESARAWEHHRKKTPA